MMRTPLVVLLVCGALGFACSSSDSEGGSIGTTCTQSGAGAGQCAAGGICGKPSDGTTSLQCLKTCTVQTDCPADQDCNGVDGATTKGCRPKSGTDAGADSGKK